MVSSGSWRDHFKIDDKILKAFWDEFSDSSPIRASELTLKTAVSTTEFVLWCVREGYFTEEAFTKFQSEAFNLPVIRHAFFETPIDHSFWERVKDLHPWTASCFPIADWEGFLLIGSVWPTETFKSSMRHRLVLGTPSSLREFHTRFLDKEKPIVAAAPAPFTIPERVMAAAVEHNEPPTARIENSIPKKQTAPVVEKPNSDSGDPFAALSRELGISSSDETPMADNAHSELGEAPEGLVMPEGLSFSKDEFARLDSVAATSTDEDNALEGLVFDNADETAREPSPVLPEDASGVRPEVQEGGTIVHNFETGNQEVVARKSEPVLSIQNESAQNKSTPSIDDGRGFVLPVESELALTVDDSTHQESVFEPVPAMSELDAFDKLALDLKNESAGAALEDTQPSVVIDAVPSMPFAPIVTPASPAKVKPAAPPPPPLRLETPEEAAQSARPIAEATIVVNAANAMAPASPATAKIRKPLFEPVGNPAAVAPANPGATHAPSETQSGQTGTATRARRLEATPMTSFFGISSTSGRVRNESVSRRAITISKIEPIHLDQCSSIDEAGAQALLQACNIFETAMILLFKDGELQPWKWSDLFLSVNGEKPEPIELKDPSIFKVAFRTAKPYHGYVVTSVTNQKFFNEFYRGMLPKHATVAPVMIDGRMGGMLLGFTNSKIDYRQSLRLMERLSFDLGRVFKNLRGTMSKAS